MYIFQYPGTIRDNPTVGNVRKQEQSHPQQKQNKKEMGESVERNPNSGANTNFCIFV